MTESVKTIQEWLDEDPATQEARAHLQALYTFDAATLVGFAQHLLVLGYIAAIIEPIRPPTAAICLDDDFTAAEGWAVAIAEVARLRPDADGQVHDLPDDSAPPEEPA